MAKVPVYSLRDLTIADVDKGDGSNGSKREILGKCDLRAVPINLVKERPNYNKFKCHSHPRGSELMSP